MSSSFSTIRIVHFVWFPLRSFRGISLKSARRELAEGPSWRA